MSTNWFAALVPYRWRPLHRAYAESHGYFWLPCPLCERPFGGHEWRDIDGLRSSVPVTAGGVGMSVGICPTCTKAGRGRPPVMTGETT